MEVTRLHLSRVAIIMRIPTPELRNVDYIRVHCELTSREGAQPMIIFLCIIARIMHDAFCNAKM
jgi:hypothetical protein